MLRHMKKVTSLLVRVLLPLALLPTAVANADTAEQGDQKFAQNLDKEGMLFNFNLQKRIAQDYCESMIVRFNLGYGGPDLSDKTDEVQKEYGLPHAYAFETLLRADAYCWCVDSYLLEKRLFERGDVSTRPTMTNISHCSAFELEYAYNRNYKLPMTL